MAIIKEKIAMELESLIKSISEFGILIVIAAIYLIQNLKDSSAIKKILGEVKDLLNKMSKESAEKNHNALFGYEFEDYIKAYTKQFKYDVLTEVITVVHHNNVASNEAYVKKSLHDRIVIFRDNNAEFLNEKTYKGRAVKDIIKEIDVEPIYEVSAEFVFEHDNQDFSNFIRKIDLVFASKYMIR